MLSRISGTTWRKLLRPDFVGLELLVGEMKE